MTPTEAFEQSVAELGPLADTARNTMAQTLGVDTRFVLGMGDRFTLYEAVQRVRPMIPSDGISELGLAVAIFTASIVAFDFSFNQEGRLCFSRRGT